MLTKHDLFEKPALPRAAGPSDLMDRFSIIRRLAVENEPVKPYLIGHKAGIQDPMKR
jgi:hypothetical protein